MKDLVIIGAGGFGREVLTIVDDINKEKPTWNFLGFIDDNASGQTVEGDKIIGTVNDLIKMEDKPLVSIAIASAEVRERLVGVLEENGFKFATLIHPTCKIGPNVTIGEGSIICRENLFTTNIKVGKHCILNVQTITGHDTVFEDYVSAMSQGSFAGDCVIGKGCYFGLRCTVINLVNIVGGCTFGACCTVVKDIVEPGTYVGTPAKKIK